MAVGENVAEKQKALEALASKTFEGTGGQNDTASVVTRGTVTDRVAKLDPKKDTAKVAQVIEALPEAVQKKVEDTKQAFVATEQSHGARSNSLSGSEIQQRLEASAGKPKGTGFFQKVKSFFR